MSFLSRQSSNTQREKEMPRIVCDLEKQQIFFTSHIMTIVYGLYVKVFFLSEWALSFRIDPLWNGDCHRQYWNNWLNWPIVMKYRLSNERKLRTDLNAEVASSVCSQLRQLNALSCWNLLISYSIGSSELVSKDSISKIANKLQQCHYKWNPFLRTGDILGDISMWNMLKLTCLLLPAINLPIA